MDFISVGMLGMLCAIAACPYLSRLERFPLLRRLLRQIAWLMVAIGMIAFVIHEGVSPSPDFVPGG